MNVYARYAVLYTTGSTAKDREDARMQCLKDAAKNIVTTNELVTSKAKEDLNDICRYMGDHLGVVIPLEMLEEALEEYREANKEYEGEPNKINTEDRTGKL